MILWIVLLMSHCCFSLNRAAAESTTLERIKKCATRCSQGLQCKPKANGLFPRPCQKPAEVLNASSVFHNISFSTVMSCQGRQKCSLHLRIKTLLQLSESIHGVSICTATIGMMNSCRTFVFAKASRQKMAGLQVEVENDCTDISPNQQVQVTVKTVPNYCDVTWTGTYDAPGCFSGDLRRHVPECITGRLSYDADTERREMIVNVSDMLEDSNYYVRLCRKDFICIGTEAIKLINKEEPVKSAVLPYSRPLPCLCIEGWSAVADAPRVQVCPFKDRLEELWSGVTFDPLEQTLSWEPACPVTAVVTLCHKGEDGVCVALPHASRNVSRDKMTFAKVDPHPQLCIKFTVGSQSWTSCPFAQLSFKAWELVVSGKQGHEAVKMLAHTDATFSVGQCVNSAESGSCHIAETHSLHVERNKAVALNLTLCKACLQVKRVDVNYAVPVTHCFDQCMHQRRRQKRRGNKKGPTANTVASALQTQTHLHEGILIPDSPQCGNAEKAVLISK
ncbi:putative interleukin-17 receptor E-like isoform X2 [Betta splendens]|uniref:Interleukin-17 receptor E-like isoform X2 n=1 Tax=Betta splendens TaxID=158456 RepID=A0A6P7NFA7_BETSP|nr:putative interleukin-17 receptor E-like isoform X2 [Betta splendens]